MKIAILIIMIIFSTAKTLASDSLKVHVFGQFFKNESFKFYDIIGNKVVYKKVKKGAQAFAFYVIIPDSLKDGDVIELEIRRKPKWGLRYRDTYTVILFDPSKKYLILERDFRLKNRYAFVPVWSNRPFGGLVKSEYWISKEIPARYMPDKVETNFPPNCLQPKK